MVHIETCRLLINLLVLFPAPEPPPSLPTAEADWDAVVPDEGVLPGAALLDRPPSPRSWESIGLQLPQIQEMIVHLCTTLTKESNAKLLRLWRFGLGVLAYFACEKIEGVVESYYHGNINSIMDMNLKNFTADPNNTQTCCYIINNVSYVSDPIMYAVMKKDKSLRSSLQQAIKFLPRGHEGTTYCNLTEKLLGESELAKHDMIIL